MSSYIPLRSLCALWLIVSLTAWATPATPANLDNELGRVVSTSYNRLAKGATNNANLSSTQAQAEKAFQAQDYAGAIKILAANRALSNGNLVEKDMQAIIRLALKLYCHIPIEQLLVDAQQQSNRQAEAQLTFELARFYAANEQWDKITGLFSDDSLLEQLTKNDQAEAYILLGTSLQKQKKHREAMRIYEKIPAGSEHFRLAQLNLASAYLRQDWWTDAYGAINAALKENKGKRDLLDYRLFTMLGYSQIQFGFYRDARESFRNVAISSEYAQRALLGLGVAALHQQDFIGALNAFDKLRAQPQQDISVAEAYLLSAFSMRQLEQFEAATARYQEAIDYYQKLSGTINARMESATPAKIIFLRAEHRADKLIHNNTRKLALLDGLAQANPGEPEAAAIAALKNKLGTETGLHVSSLLREEKTVIDSYLSQSQFGLASLYDHK